MVKLTRAVQTMDFPQDDFESVLEKLQYLTTQKGLDIDLKLFSVSELIDYWRPYLRGGQKVDQALQYLEFEASDFVRRVSELCALFGYVLTDQECKLEFFRYTLLGLYGITISELKYACTLVFDAYWNQPFPDPSRLVCGFGLFPRRLGLRLWRYCAPFNATNSRHRRNPKVQYLINTVFMGFKKGLLPSRPDAIQSSLQKHRKALTKSGVIDVRLFDDVDRIVQGVVSQIKIRPSIIGDRKQSSKSTIDSSYGEGGNIGFAYQRIFKSDVVHVPEFVGFKTQMYPADSRFSNQHESPCAVCRTYECDCKHKYGSWYPLRRWGWDVDPVYISRPFFARDVIESLDDHLLESSLSRCFDGNRVVPAYVLEPMKVRIITKPEVAIHSHLHAFQHATWKALRDHKSGFFQIIGEPLERLHLWKIVQGWFPGRHFLSGDFSQATDNLKSEISEIILKHLYGRFANANPLEYQTIINSMLHSKVCQSLTTFPTYESEFLNGYEYSDLVDFEQTNGQLMGNVMSFSVLCIANYVSYHLSQERYLERQLRAFCVPPVLINGDDILFQTNLNHASVGIKLSGNLALSQVLERILFLIECFR